MFNVTPTSLLYKMEIKPFHFFLYFLFPSSLKIENMFPIVLMSGHQSITDYVIICKGKMALLVPTLKIGPCAVLSVCQTVNK